jgi:epoxide hydrolase-like predicted phosphatase
MTIKATIWDFSRVLLQPRMADPHATIAHELGIDPLKFANYFNGEENARMDLGEESEAEFYRRIICEQGLKMDALDIFDRYFFDLFYVNEELIDFIRRSRPQFKTAICSNFSRQLRSLLEKKWKIIDAFDVLVISSEVKLLKPDPRIYQLTLKRLHLEPQETIFIDDTEKNVLGAQALGIHGILFKDSRETIAQIEKIIQLQVQ